MHLVLLCMSITNIYGLRIYNTSNRINTRHSENKAIINQSKSLNENNGDQVTADKFKKTRGRFEGHTTQDNTNEIKVINQEIPQSYNPLNSKQDSDIKPIPKDENKLKIDAAIFSKINFSCTSYLKSLSKFSLPTAYFLKNIKFHQARYLATTHQSNEFLNQIFPELKIFNLFMITNGVVPSPEDTLSDNLENNTSKKGKFYFTKNKKLHVLNNILEVLKKAREIASIYNNFGLIEEINVFIELNEGLINNLQNHDIDYLTTIKDPRILMSLHLSNIKINKR